MRDLQSENVFEYTDSFVTDCTYEGYHISTAAGETSTQKPTPKQLGEDDILEWASKKLDTKDSQGRNLSHTRILIAVGGSNNDYFRRCPLSRNAYRALQEGWSLPARIASHFYYGDGANHSLRSPYDVEKTATTIGMTFRLSGHYTIVAAYDVATRTNNVFIASTHYYYLQKIRDHITECPELVRMPSGILFAAVLGFRQQVLNHEIGGQVRRLNDTRNTLGMNPYEQVEASKDELRRDDRLLTAMEQLTSLAQEFAQAKEDVLRSRRVCESIRQVHKDFCKTQSNTSTLLQADMDECAARVDDLDSWLEMDSGNLEVRQAEVQGLVQTVYCMVANLDNSLNYQVAEASLRLAALSRQDSTDMRVTAGVTFVFLPGTFVATFFSTSFFNFQPQGNDHASQWVWIYFVVTVALTLCCVAIWRTLSRAGIKETERFQKMVEDERNAEDGREAREDSPFGLALDDLRTKMQKLKRRETERRKSSVLAGSETVLGAKKQ